MSTMVTSQPSVLIGAVPLFAVNRISLNENYALPPVGDKGLSQSTGKITRTVQIEAALIGTERHADPAGAGGDGRSSKTLPALVLGGLRHPAGRRADDAARLPDQQPELQPVRRGEGCVHRQHLAEALPAARLWP